MRSAAAGCLVAIAAGVSLFRILKRVSNTRGSDRSSNKHNEVQAQGQDGTAGGKVCTTDAAAKTHDEISSNGQSATRMTDSEVQQDVARLQSLYASMAADFWSQGLDLQAIAEAAAWFETGPTAPWPRRYSSFHPKPLSSSAVRLLVIPISTCCPRLANLAARLSGEILACLPPGYKVFSNARQDLHITVFHFSHPADPRPDALDPLSGLGQLLQHTSVGQPASSNQSAVAIDRDSFPAPGDRPGPTPQQLEREQSAASAVLSGIGPFTLQVEQVLVAQSGVLLLTWTDPSGELGKLRRQLRQTFPGACSRQSSIIHTSLFRIVETPATSVESGVGRLSAANLAAIQAACDKWTSKVQSMQMSVSRLWWVEEHEFSTIEGLRVPMNLSSSA